MCLVNLALLTGNIGRRGAGVNPLRGQNNVQGAALMGCEPGSLTGGVPLAENAALFAEAWQSPVPTRLGLNLLEMIDAAKAGHLHALWAIGYDVALTNPQADDTLRALRSLDFLVVQDLFLNETARLAAHVFLPACSTFEKNGTFMNSERRLQRVRKVIEPHGESQPDGEILRRVAEAMGYKRELSMTDAEAVWNEIRRVWPAVSGITYERLDAGGLQWPCPSVDHPGTPVLHDKIFEDGRRVSLRRVAYRPSPEQASNEYPLLLNTGRSLYQFNASTMTSRALLNELRPEDQVQISADDAAAYGIVDGQLARLRSRYGDATLVAHVSKVVRHGELFATFHTPTAFLNRLTGPYRDAVVHTPEYKLTAVAIEPLG
jgi:formate dehydrogenase major subunit